MTDEGWSRRSTAAYTTWRVRESNRLSRHAPIAPRAAANSMTRRARHALHALRDELETIAPPAIDLQAVIRSYDQLVAADAGACLMVVAPERAAEAERLIVAAHQRARARAVQRLRRDVDDIVANHHRSRLERAARSGAGWLVAGGGGWRVWEWASQHWPWIAAHLHH